MQEKRLGKLTIHPLTPARWADLERLFGPRGACGGCWCMWWRVARTQFVKQRGEGNRRTLKRIVSAEGVPGLLAYAHGEPVGWCAVGPRDDYPVLERSRVLKRVDTAPVWSVVCFFVAKPHRRQGLTTKLLRAAVKYARANGARIVEGYPVDPHSRAYPDVFAFTGMAAAFRQAGFVEILRRSQGRPIMRHGRATARITPQWRPRESVASPRVGIFSREWQR